MNKFFSKEATFTDQQCKNKFSELKSKYTRYLQDQNYSGFGADGLPGDSTVLEELLDANPSALQSKTVPLRHFDLMADIVGDEVSTGKLYIIILFFPVLFVYCLSLSFNNIYGTMNKFLK